MSNENQTKPLDLFKITDLDYSYVIAEIGNNHQGSFDKAIKLIDQAVWAGADAVKFQKRSNKDLFTPEYYNSPYINDNSFAESYGEHREFVELSLSELAKLKTYSDQKGIIFFATPFDFVSLEDLEKLNLPFYKVASADIVHTPFLKKIGEKNRNVILSTGHSTYDDVTRAVDCFKNNSLAILHCTAAYPAPIESMNLKCIPELKKKFPNNIVGISDHENGIDAACVAYMLGARVFEKHLTLNRSDKGTDHKFSLEPIGLQKLVRNLRRIPKMLGDSDKRPLSIEKNPITKMRKSIVYKDFYEPGKLLDKECFEYRCPGDGLPPYLIDSICKKVLKTKVDKFAFVKYEDLI